MAASLEVGQPDMNTGSNPDETPTQSDLNAPYGLAFDHSGNLWVADTGYNRVLEFPLPFSNGESATLVVGQSNFTSGIYPNEPGCPPQCGTPSAQSLNNPGTVSFDSQGNLWVADTHDDRILEYTGPFSTGMAASLVLGHSDFSTGAGFCTSQSCFQTPFAASFDNSGSLWVADTVNYRMLEFNSPFSSDQNASVVLGQPDFITMAPPSGQINATSSDMNGPQGLAVDKSGDLWVADTGDNRILEFMAGAAPTTSTSSSSSSTSTSSASTTATTATSQASTPTSSTTAVTAGSSTTNTGGGSIPEFPGGGLVFLAFTVAVVGAYLVLRPRDRTPRA